MTIFNTIGKACQLQNGKTYNSFDELLKDFEGKPALVFAKNEENENNGKTYNNLNVKMWNKTKFPDVQHQFKGKDQRSEERRVGKECRSRRRREAGEGAMQE